MTKITIHVEPPSTDVRFEVIKDIDGLSGSLGRPELPVIEV